jgi:hypothetical protein
MSVKLDIYDFFSYFIPGGIVTAAFLFILSKHFALEMDFSNSSIIEFLVLGIVSYLVGYAADFVAGKTWYKLFRRKDIFENTMRNFNKRHASFEVGFQEMDWYIPYSFVKNHNLDMAQDIDKLNVTNKMLRTSSFGIFLFAIIFTVEFFLNGYSPVYAILSASCLIIAVILAREAVKFSRWFYETIFQSLVAIIAKPEQMPVKFRSKTKRSKSDGD